MAREGWWSGDPLEADDRPDAPATRAATWWEDDPIEAPPAKAARSPMPAFDEMGQPTVPEPPAQVAVIPEPAPFVPQDERSTIGAMGRQVARGAIETVGLMPKGAAGLGARLDYNEQDIANATDRYAAASPAERAQMRREAMAQFRDNPGTRDSLLSRFSDIDEGVAVPRPQAVTPVEQRQTFKAGEAIDEYGRTRFPTTKEEDAAFWTGQVPRALGSTLGMAPVALAGAPFGALGRLMAGVGLATTGSGEAVDAALERRRALEDMVRSGDAPAPESYPTDRQIATAAGQGLAPGALDAAAIDNLLRPVVRVPGFRGLITAIAKKAIEQGVVEGTTEGVQQVMQNVIAKLGYNPSQEVLEQVAENVLVGGVVGVLTGGVAGGMIRPARGGRQDPVDQGRQQQEIPPDVSRETVAPVQAGEINPPAPATAPAGADLQNQEIPPPVLPAPTPEDLQAVLDDPRPVAEIMAERERQAQRQTTIAAVEQEDGPEAAAAVAKVMDGAGRRDRPMQAETAADVDMAAAQAAQPTPAQAEAGNYRKGHVTVQGLDIAIEVPRGGERTGVGPDGRPWSVQMPAHYGYLKAGKDSGDGKVDVFVGDLPDAPYVYVIDQIDPATGKFDEPKVMMGMGSETEAGAFYDASYSDGSGPARMGAITRLTVSELKAWLRNGNPKKPLAYVPGPPVSAPTADAWASDPIVVNAAENARILAAVDENGVPLNWARPALPNNPPPFSENRPASTVVLDGQTAAPSSAGFPSPGPMPTTVAPQDPLAQARAFAAERNIRLSGAEMVDVRELVAEGVDPEEAVEIALTRSGLEMADEIVAVTEEAPNEVQTQAEAEPARASGEVPAQEGRREEPADARAEAGRAPQGEQPRGAGQSAPEAEPVAPEPKAEEPAQPAPERDPIDAALDTALDEQFGKPQPKSAPAKRDVPRDRVQKAKEKARAKQEAEPARPVRGHPGYFVDRTPTKRLDDVVANDLANPRRYVAQAFRASPWHSVLGYGDTPDAAVTDALSRLGITEAPRTAGQATTSAAKNTAAGLGEATTALVRLFGAKPGRLTSGIGFDEDTYREARPHFVAAMQHFRAAAGDIAEAARALVRHLAANGLDRAGIEAMRPYLFRFLGEVRDGRVDLDPATMQAEDSPKETPNERTDVRDEGTQALDEVAAGEGQSPERLGSADGRDAGGGQDGRGADAGADAAGVSKPRGRGGRAGGVRSAAAGTGRRRPRVGDAGAREDGEGAPQSDGGLTPETASPPNIPAINFQITPELRLGKGGEVEKFNDNIAAIRIVKQLEAEKRRATPDEQAKLARYVGWGGLANAFPEPGSGEFKEKWKQRGEELRNLLTAKEYAAARRSTRNAHYTSETVVSFMWDAARRLGFRGGMALESSMGTGNFIGLKPADIPAHFIGIEYDSTTARIAAHLYPQSTVLHAGFHQAPLPDNVFALNIGNPPFGNESLRFQHRPELNGVSIHNQFFRAGILSVRPGGLQIMVVSRFLMDAQDNATRAALAREAKLIAAIRLPDTAFKENARTEVVTDVIILQRLTDEERREAGEIIDALQAQPKKDRQEEAQRAALAGRAPEWIATETVKDPLGGEPITVNGYFASNPDQIVGVLERSGSMSHGADVTVRLDDPTTLAARLAKLVKRLPENVSKIGNDVIAATEERFKLLSDSLRIAIANEEPGHLSTTPEGKILRVIEREGPDGGFLFEKMEITADSPWSDRLSMDPQGRWYSLDLVVDEKGDPVKETGSDGKPTRRNLYQRTVYEKLSDVPQSMRLGDLGFARIKQIVRMRDLVRDQIVLETEDAPTKTMEANRRKLADAYEAFTRDNGPINRPANLRLVNTMPDGGLVAALESKYTPERSAAQAAKSGQDPQSEKATPAPILKSRAIPKYESPTSAATAADGLVISLAERGRVDLARIAELRGTTEQEVIDELQAGDKPQIFFDPETQTWETANAYLTGPVKRKLLAAREKGIEINVKALEAVQPEPWPSENIAVQLGATWVPTDVYAAFAEHIFGGKTTVRFSRVTNGFDLQVMNADETKAEQYKAQGSVTSASGEWILSRVLNSQMPRVTYTDSDDVPRVDSEATDLAIQIGGTMRAEFQDWIFADSERRQQLTDLFNEKFNTRVARQHDGSHLILPGKVPDQVIAMRRHQKNAIWRGISERFLLIDHVVGAGKTFTAIARAMERRRMGLSRKAMVIVPNHLVEQWEADTYRLYPGAKVLAAGKKDFEAKNRRRLFGRIATGDWDIVIVPHSSFSFIGISPDTELRFLEGEMRDAMAAIEEAWEQAREDGADQGFRKPFNVKEAERLAEKIQQRMDKVRAGTRDRLLTFEQLGVDDLTVDEAHEFKNLFYSSRMTGVRGMGDKTGSRKASDLYNKVRVLRESGGAVTFMTGTPISNSAVEMYSMMRYLAADKLDEQGLTHFDAWRAQYVEALPKLEPTESGALKSVTRLGRRWANMRSLMELYYEFTDAVSLDDIKKWYAEDNAGKSFPVPKVKIASNKEKGDRQLIALKPTEAQEELLREVLSGFNGLDSIKDPKERNAARLRLMDRARKLSLDVRAVDPQHESKEKGGKLERVADEVKRIYDATTKDRGTQLVFLDRSVPRSKSDAKIIKDYDDLIAKQRDATTRGDEAAYQEIAEKLEKFDRNEIDELRAAQAGGWNAYDQIKQNLVARGIPANQIRFIQEANNDEQKAAMFEAVNGGKARVLIGSTPRMGAGTNVQERLVALHHVDVTWKPSDIEQREGRIIRQGNKLLEKYGSDFSVEVIAYATEKTVDAKMWDLNSTKLNFINGIRKYDGTFEMEVDDADSVSMAEMAALASGDPLLLERVQAEIDISALEVQERGHRRKLYAIGDQRNEAEKWIDEGDEKIAKAKADQEWAAKQVGAIEAAVAKRKVNVDGKDYTSEFAAMQAAKAAIAEQQGGDEKIRYSIQIDGKAHTNQTAIEDTIKDAIGVPYFEMTLDGKVIRRPSRAGVTIATRISEAYRDNQESVSLGTMMGMEVEADLSSKIGQTINVYLNFKLGKRIWAQEYVGQLHSKNKTAAWQRVSDRLESVALGVRHTAGSSTQWMVDRIEKAKRDLPRLREQADQPFPKAAELKAKRERLRELVGILTEKPKTAADPEGGDTGPATLRQAMPAGATVRAQVGDRARFRVAGEIDATVSLTPQDKRRRAATLRALTVTLRRMAGASSPEASVVDTMMVGEQEILGAYSPADNLIAVSMRTPDPIGTVRHETIHVLRQLGLIDDAAWSALAQAAETGGWLDKHSIAERWGDENLTREQALEEAIAEEFGVAMRDGVWKTGNARADAIFQRIAEFFRRVRAEVKRALSAAGMRDLSDADVAEYVFSLIERGAFREGKPIPAARREAMAQSRERPISEAKFYSSHAQHIDIRSRETGKSLEAREKILREGFDRGGYVNAIPPWRGGAPRNVIEMRYKPVVGDVVYLAPKGAWKDTPNGMSIQKGWVPKPYEAIVITKENVGRSMYENYIEALDRYRRENPDLYQAGKATKWTAIEDALDALSQDIDGFREGEFDPAAARKLLDRLSDAERDDPRARMLDRGLLWLDGQIDADQDAIADQINGVLAQLRDDGPLYQMAASGAQAAANTPQPRKMRALRAAIRALRGGDAVDPLAKVRVPNDIGWARKTTVTPRTIAAYFPAFADAFFRGVDQFRARDMSISELTEIARPYLDLDQASKEKVGKVIEHGRMAGEVYATEEDGTIVVENKIGQQVRGKIGGVTLMADGETVTLDPKEAAAYRAYRRVMDRALNKFRDQIVREWGFDPSATDAPKDAADVEALARETENAGERARLKTLSAVLSSIETAKRRGYVPFTRYGSHYVTVTSMQDGKTVVVHREHIEPGLTSNPKALGPLKRLTIPRLEQQAAALRARLAEIYPPSRGFQISELREVTPASFDDIPDFSDLDAIIAAANLPPDQASAVQQAIGEVIQKRGFRAHFIKSRNIPGYSVDFERSLADYIVGISGYLARREYLPQIETAIASIPATQAEMRRYAKEWNDYIQNPSEEWNGLRQAGFLWYLSGRLSSALVNLSQIPMVTAPYLSMFASPVQASAEIARAYKDAGLAIRPKPKSMGGAGLDFFDPDALPADVREAVKRAIADGTLLPIETFQEMARAQGKTPKSRSIGAKAKTAQDAAAFMFQAAERTNRLVSFIAAYRLAQRPEVMGRIKSDLRANPLWTRRTKDRRQDAATFAAFVVEETQFLLGKVNRTKMMRGPGSVIFQFKSFAANYLELMARLGAFGSGVHRGGRNYAALAGMAFALFMVGGLLGLPGAEDGLEMIEALIQSMTGVDPQIERGLREAAGSLAAWAARQLGAGEETQDTASRFAGRSVARGPLREVGVDVSQRIGQGRFVPKPTGTEHDSFWYRAIGLAGIPGSWVLRGIDAGSALARGDLLQAGIRLAPEAIADLGRASQLATDGVRTIAKGRQVMRPDEELPDGTTVGGASNVAKRALGFQPTGISRAREQMNAVRRAGEAPRDLFADFNLRRANIQAAINRADAAVDAAKTPEARKIAEAAVAREAARMKRVMGEIESYNASAPGERQYKLQNPGYAQQLKTANQGQRETQTRKLPMRVRGSAEDIRARF